MHSEFNWSSSSSVQWWQFFDNETNSHINVSLRTVYSSRSLAPILPRPLSFPHLTRKDFRKQNLRSLNRVSKLQSNSFSFSSSSSPPVDQRTRQKLEFISLVSLVRVSRLFSFEIRLKSIVSVNSFYFSINSFYLLLDLECDLTCLFFSLIIINRINHNVTS